MAATQLPDRPLLVLAFGAGGVELLGIGVVSRRVEWLAAAPWAFLAAWVTFASGALTGDPQWFTVPVGLTILGVIGIVRWSRRRDGVDPALEVLSVSELLGMVLLVGPALVESVTRSPAYGLLAAGIGLALAVFGALTRVRRRLAVGVAGLLVALLLMVVPPLLELVPPLEGSVPWIILAVVGLLALFTAAFLEKGRRLAHRGVRAVAELTRGWE